MSVVVNFNGSITPGTPGGHDWRYSQGMPLFHGYSSYYVNYEMYVVMMYFNASNTLDEERIKELYNRAAGIGYTSPSAVTAFKACVVPGITNDRAAIWYAHNQPSGELIVGAITYVDAQEPVSDTSHYPPRSATVSAGVHVLCLYRHITGGQYGIGYLNSSTTNFNHYDKTRNYTYYYGIPYFEHDGTTTREEARKAADEWLRSTGGTPGGNNTDAKGDYDGILGGLFKLYEIDKENLNTLGEIVKLGWLSGNIGDSIIDLKMLMAPGDLNELGETTIVERAGLTLKGNPITQQGQKFDFGTYSFTESFHNFLDYSPNTTIKIFLPYCGFQNVDASIVMGGTVHLYGTIDMITGNILYYLSINNPDVTATTGENVLYCWNGNVASEIPVTAEDYGSKVSAIIGSATTIAGLSVGLNGIGNVPGMVEASANMATAALSSRYIQAGSLTSNNGLAGVQYPYIVINRPIVNYPSNYGHTVGYPSMKSATLSSLSGFTKVSEIHLNGFSGATQEELNEIERLLKEGVIL